MPTITGGTPRSAAPSPPTRRAGPPAHVLLPVDPRQHPRPRRHRARRTRRGRRVGLAVRVQVTGTLDGASPVTTDECRPRPMGSGRPRGRPRCPPSAARRSSASRSLVNVRGMLGRRAPTSPTSGWGNGVTISAANGGTGPTFTPSVATQAGAGDHRHRDRHEGRLLQPGAGPAPPARGVAAGDACVDARRPTISGTPTVRRRPPDGRGRPVGRRHRRWPYQWQVDGTTITSARPLGDVRPDHGPDRPGR